MQVAAILSYEIIYLRTTGSMHDFIRISADNSKGTRVKGLCLAALAGLNMAMLVGKEMFYALD